MPESCYKNQLLRHKENPIKEKEMVTDEKIKKSSRAEPATSNNNIIKLDIACPLLNLLLNFPYCFYITPERNN